MRLPCGSSLTPCFGILYRGKPDRIIPENYTTLHTKALTGCCLAFKFSPESDSPC